MNNNAFFATCAKGVEQVLEQELIELGAIQTKTSVAGVYFYGNSIGTALKVCLWSRCASRILMPLLQASDDSLNLYNQVKAFEWNQHMLASHNLWINFVMGVPSHSNHSQTIRHSRFGAQRIKDAICDYFLEQGDQRPNISQTHADITLHARLHRGTITLSIDLSGASLHQRGYRQQQGPAPMRETLAATILYRAKWQILAQNNLSLIDPMCGSGTLLIEAAMMALNMAPNLKRSRFGFSSWLQHDQSLWESIVNDAEAQFVATCNYRKKPFITGYDSNAKVLNHAANNIQRAGLKQWIHIEQRNIEENTIASPPTQGLCITNPPYGERLGSDLQPNRLYTELGQFMKQLNGWNAAVIVSDKTLGKAIGIHSHKQYKVYNGSLECQLLLFRLSTDTFIDTEKRQQLSDESTMVLNRLNKNFSKLKHWLKKENLECYRLYNADLPEYAAAIDIYGKHIVLQSYKAPKSIALEKAQFRERQLIRSLQVFAEQQGFDTNNIHLRCRQQQKGANQYGVEGNLEPHNIDFQLNFHRVTEGNLHFNTSFERYLDTGLFLDHRPLRRWLQEQSNGKKILNLFCYTASLSIAAACGSAASTLNIDMSNTYLRWAQHNFKLNKLPCNFNKRSLEPEQLTQGNQLLKVDCIAWLQQQYLANYPLAFDTILLDPPTFSNSKSMAQSLDIQRDHNQLIRLIMPMLKDNGILYFSTNKRQFKLDTSLDSTYHINDISCQSIDKDFQSSHKSQRIHQLWSFQHQQ